MTGFKEKKNLFTPEYRRNYLSVVESKSWRKWRQNWKSRSK